MKQITKQQAVFMILGYILIFSSFTFGLDGGMGAVKGLLKEVTDGFISFSKIVLTLAFLWVGFKVLFQGSSLRDLAPVIIGAIIIGSAAALAKMFDAQAIAG